MGTVVATVQHGRLASFARRAGSSVADRARVTAAIAAAHGDPALLGRLSPGTLIAVRDSLLSGISSALYIGGGVVLVGAVVAWALLRRVSAADAPAADAAAGTLTNFDRTPDNLNCALVDRSSSGGLIWTRTPLSTLLPRTKC